MESEGLTKKPSLLSRLSSRMNTSGDQLIASPRSSNATPRGPVKRSNSRIDGPRQSRSSIYSRASAQPEYSEEDANAMILRANEPPNYDGGFNEIMKQIKARKFYTKQFQAIQEQVEMGKTLYFSNISPTFYESSYLHVAQQTSVNRVRICYSIGIIALTILYFQEYRYEYWDKNDDLGRTEQDKIAIICITLGGILLPATLAFLSTFTSFGRRNLENITLSVFALVAIMMIVKKPVEKFKGPVIPLLILLIPIFGITRMRFLKSCILGWSIFFLYFITMCITREYRSIIPNPKKFDDFTNISYQSINYGISVIGGMVSQYRQELLRRRNFCLQLPFSGALDEDSVAELTTDKFSKRALMKPWSQKFRHPLVEECFYKYWYLIDPFPYDNPNAGTLHKGVFRTIRFAVITLLLNQLVLLLQDIKILLVKPDNYVEKWDFLYALCLRYGVTVPLYLSAAAFMYFVGKAFCDRWVQEAEALKNKSLGLDMDLNIAIPEGNKTEPQDSAHINELVADKEETPYHLHSDAPQNGTNRVPQIRITRGVSNRLRRVAEVVRLRRMASVINRERMMDVILKQSGGYVRSTQVFSSLVIACHVFCMGLLLLLLSRDRTPKPLYYMGFLNAVLFAHRSGFRVRFVYATLTTGFVAIIICVIAAWKASDHVREYAAYVAVILSLGMMISYEEENLRRTFFVLKSIRTLEFEEWFGYVLRIQGWVKERFHKRLRAVRDKKGDESPVQSTKKHEKYRQKIILVNTSAQMAMASRLGMYSQVFNICIAIVDVLSTALQ